MGKIFTVRFAVCSVKRLLVINIISHFMTSPCVMSLGPDEGCAGVVPLAVAVSETEEMWFRRLSSGR